MSNSVRITIKREDLPALEWWVELGLQGCALPDELPDDLAAARQEDISAAERFLEQIKRAKRRGEV